jgi:outer membrane protein
MLHRTYREKHLERILPYGPRSMFARDSAARRTFAWVWFMMCAGACPREARAEVEPPFGQAGMQVARLHFLQSAPASAPRAVTLAEALAHAREHQPQIRAALARVKTAEAEAGVPRGQWLPVVGVTAQIFGATANNTTASYVAPPFMDIPRIGATRTVSAANASFAPYASTIAAAGITQEVFDFGRIAAEGAAFDALVEARKHTADAERLDVELSVEEAFFAVHASKAVLTAAEQAFDRSRAHRDLARAGVVSGLRPPIELTRAEADLQRFDIGRIRARGGVQMAQGVLAAAVGSNEPALDAAGPAPTPAEMPALGIAIEQASERDPRVKEALAQLRAQEEQTRAVSAELRPDLSLTGTVSARAGGAPPSSGNAADYSGLLPSVPNWDIGLVLSWPIFDGVIDARKRASRATEQVRREEIEAARLDLVARIREAYVAVIVARDALPGIERAVEAAVANYAQAEARFKAGLGTSVELADAEALRTDAEIQLGLGSFALARARAAFGRAIAEGL